MFPSLRLGFMVVPRKLAGSFDRAMSVTGQFAPTVLQVAVAEFIRQGHFANHLRKMRRIYARRQDHFVQTCRAHLAPWIQIEENDAGMQLLGQFTTAMKDRDVVDAAARRGLDLHALSINYFRDPPLHGILFGYAALNEQETNKAILALRDTFREFEGLKVRRRRSGQVG
jgi:GntR family transcriptional regulator / MocR family aminotransferase